MMVTRWGLSEELGTVAYGENQDEVFLGYQVSRQQNISEDDFAQDRCRDASASRGRLSPRRRQILTEKRADLETLARGLLEFETLTGDEIKDLLAGKRPVRESVIEPSGAALLRGAAGRQAPPAAGAADRRGRAAAAGLKLHQLSVVLAGLVARHARRLVRAVPAMREPGTV